MVPTRSGGGAMPVICLNFAIPSMRACISAKANSAKQHMALARNVLLKSIWMKFCDRSELGMSKLVLSLKHMLAGLMAGCNQSRAFSAVPQAKFALQNVSASPSSERRNDWLPRMTEASQAVETLHEIVQNSCRIWHPRLLCWEDFALH